MVMGVSGLTLAYQKAEQVSSYSTSLSNVFGALTTLIFLSLSIVYAIKSFRYWPEVVKEFRHPVKLNFIPTISISIILLSNIWLNFNLYIAHFLFIIGVLAHLSLTLSVLHSWFNHQHYQEVHLNPAWFIPIVGNILVPIPGVTLGFVELSWFFFSIGIVFWLLLFSIILNRILFHNPLPERLMPTLFILIAPPAIGFISYIKLIGDIDAVGRILYYFSLFITLFLATQLRKLLRLKFFMSWWAYSFPLAAITIASWLMFEITRQSEFYWLGIILLCVLTIAVFALLLRTVIAIVRKEICRPE